MDSVQLFTITSGPIATHCYVVIVANHITVIDPSSGSFEKVERLIQEKAPSHPIVDQVILTHSHWDHIADCHLFCKKYNMPLLVHHEDGENLKKPGSDGLPMMFPIVGCAPTGLLEEGQEIALGSSLWQVIHTPGHSPGSVCLFCPEEHMLIAGDTLFKGSIGNLSFPTSDPERMWLSLKKLSTLPPETIVYPGHGPTTTIGREGWLARAEEIFG